MHCAQIKTKLAEYSVGLLDVSEREAIEAHVAGCASCARELRALQRVDSLLGAVRPEEPPAQLWENIRARIESTPQGSPTPAWRGWLTVPRLALGSAAIAALMLAALHFGDLLPRQSDAPLHDNPTQLMQTHQMMSWDDPLSDKAALGVLLATRSQAREVP